MSHSFVKNVNSAAGKFANAANDALYNVAPTSQFALYAIASPLTAIVRVQLGAKDVTLSLQANALRVLSALVGTIGLAPAILTDVVINAAKGAEYLENKSKESFQDVKNATRGIFGHHTKTLKDSSKSRSHIIQNN